MGGGSEMRAQFDSWLEREHYTFNPCIPDTWTDDYGPCKRYSSLPKCLENDFGYYSRLPPADNSTTNMMCRTAVERFLGEDLMLSRWSSTDGCKKLGASVKGWGFVGPLFEKYGFEAPKYEYAKGLKTWFDVDESFKEVDNQTLYGGGDMGSTLTATLIVVYLRMIGIDPTAQVASVEGNWAEAAMLDFGLQPDWLA